MSTLRDTLKDHPVMSILTGLASVATIIGLFISLRTNQNSSNTLTTQSNANSISNVESARTDKLENEKFVQLDFSHPNEKWRKAEKEELEWIIGDWSMPSLYRCAQIFERSGNRIRTKIHGADLAAVYQGDFEKQLDNEWLYADVYISNNGILRFDYVNSKLNPFFVQREKYETCAYVTYERKLNDDGTYSSKEKIKAYNTKTCQIAEDGLTYTCKE